MCFKLGANALLIIALTVASMLFRVEARAYSTETEQSIAEEVGATEISGEYLSEEEANGDRTVNVFEKTLLIISDGLKNNGASVLKSFGAVMAMVVLCCVMGAMRFGESPALDSACGYISVLAIAGVSYSILYKLFVYITASLEALTAVMASLLPTMAALYVAGGASATGAASSSGITLFLSVLSIICTKVLLPLLQVAFMLCLSGAMPGSVNLSSVCALVKNTATTLMAFLFTLLGFVLCFQTSVASATDNFATRSVKFATGVFVPVIGGILGDASRTVIASVSVIKGTVGGAGTVLVLSAVLPPIITVILYKLMLLCCAIAAKALGCEAESRLLYDLGSVLSILLALVIGAGVVCLIGLAIFINR